MEINTFFFVPQTTINTCKYKKRRATVFVFSTYPVEVQHWWSAAGRSDVVWGCLAQENTVCTGTQGADCGVVLAVCKQLHTEDKSLT
jgi:hypothetical protein